MTKRIIRALKGIIFVLADAVADLAESVADLTAEPGDGGWLTSGSGPSCSTCQRPFPGQ